MAASQPGGLAEWFMDLCSTLEKEQSAVGLFPQTEEEEAWEEREVEAVSALCSAPVTVTPQLHHLAAALCAPERAGAAPAEQKGAGEGNGDWAVPWIRLPGEKQGLMDTQDLSLRLPNGWDFIPFKGAKRCC